MNFDRGSWKGDIDDVGVVSLLHPVTGYIVAHWYSRLDLYVTTPFLGRSPIVAKAVPEHTGGAVSS